MADFTTIEVRHAQERDALEVQIADILRAAKSKNDRKRANQQAERMRRDLYERQQSELDDSPPEPPPPPPPEPAPAVDPAADVRAAKLARNREKRLKKAEQKVQEESQFADALQHANRRGEAESAALVAQLAALGLRMGSVLGDGHCLFRAVAACRAALGEPEYADRSAFVGIRQTVASELRAHPEVYFEFSGCETMEKYEAHCEEVASTAAWGDDLELTALSNAFQMTIIVHESGRPPATRGEFPVKANLAMLRFYSTSGAHYNPVYPM
jgi:OTU domain-containing protein 6